MVLRSGSKSYLEGIRELQGIAESFRPIHIALSGNIPSGLVRNELDYLPRFLRQLEPENRLFSFLINPSQMKKNYKKIVNQHYTRGGWIIEHVSDELPQMTLSGTTASFRNPLLRDKLRKGLKGLAPMDVLDDRVRFDESGNSHVAIGYRNLLHLIDLYRNNGRVFYRDPFMGSTDVSDSVFRFSQKIKTSFPVQIIYGNEEMYEGFFTGMTLSEDADIPYSINFDLTFSITNLFEMWRKEVANGVLDNNEGSLSEE